MHLEYLLQADLYAAVCGRDWDCTGSGLCFLLQTKLKLPLRECMEQWPPPADQADAMGEDELAVCTMVNYTRLSGQRLRSPGLRQWRQQHGLEQQ